MDGDEESIQASRNGSSKGGKVVHFGPAFSLDEGDYVHAVWYLWTQDKAIDWLVFMTKPQGKDSGIAWEIVCRVRTRSTGYAGHVLEQWVGTRIDPRDPVEEVEAGVEALLGKLPRLPGSPQVERDRVGVGGDPWDMLQALQERSWVTVSYVGMDSGTEAGKANWN